MNMLLVVVLGTIFAATFTSAVHDAKVFLKVTDNKTYELVEDVLKEMSNLKRPIRVLQLDSTGIGDWMMEAIEKFKTDCKLESEIESAKEELRKTLNEKRKREEERRKQEEAEERRRKEEEEQRKKENWDSYGWDAAGLLATYIAYLSDENLKSNVTVLPYSIYNDIGLTGVCWKWNDNAQQKFGLTGEACGVIAQQVQKLYPKAVLVGEDGFVQVRYGILHTMINHVRDKRC